MRFGYYKLIKSHKVLNVFVVLLLLLLTGVTRRIISCSNISSLMSADGSFQLVSLFNLNIPEKELMPITYY